MQFRTPRLRARIYSSLGFAESLVIALRERNLLHFSFAALVLVLVAVFAVQWIRKRPGWSEVGVAIGVALAYWLAFIRIENPAERTHLVEYGRRPDGRTCPKRQAEACS